jgi:hypothetical protein
MALLNNYEIPGTGVIVPNAYHVIVHLDVEKRNTASSIPPDNYNVNRPNADNQWLAGYYGRIVVSVFKDKAQRDSGAQPIGVINANNAVNPVFMIDTASSDTYLTQAYNHLMLTDYYKDATTAQ